MKSINGEVKIEGGMEYWIHLKYLRELIFNQNETYRND